MKYINSAALLLSIILIAILIASCGSIDDPNPSGTNLSGYVTHVNKNLIAGGYYSVSVYSADSSNPFDRVPVRTDSLNLQSRDNLFETTYDMDGIQPGKYYVAATW